MSRVDDLAGLLVPPEGEDISIVQGIIRAFDPEESFENEVEVDGVIRRNIPVGSGLEALTYTPGDVVLIKQWFPGGRKGERGLATSWIDGRIITPGTGAAERAVAALRGNLAKQIAKQVLAETMFGDQIPLAGGTVSDPGSTYIAADGPSLSNIEISESGSCLLLLTARIDAQINQPTGVSAEGWMSFRVTGATVVEPADDESLNHGIFGPAADVIASTTQATRLVLVEGLNPGIHSFEARYRSEGTDPPPQTSVIFSSRNLTVVAL